MKQALQAFMKRPTTWVGIITAFMFQIIFSVIWMTGYDGVTDRVEGLTIAIVNEDASGMGETIAGNLAKELPFGVVQPSSLEDAKLQLNERELQMVVQIPVDFAEQAASKDSQATISYWINESNPALIKSMMSGAAETITAEVNRQAVAMGIQATLSGMSVPDEQAAAASTGLSERVVSDLQSVNAVQGMNNQMVPMMMVLASYVGAMIMGMNMEQSGMSISASTTRWARFGARSLINIVSAAAVSLVGASLLAALGGQIEAGFLALWGFQFLFLLTFMFVSQMFLYLFGMGGMLFNIMLLSVQLVSSGAMVPRELLNDFYTGLSKLLPATYAVDGNMNILFGGPGVGNDALALLAIGAVAVVVSAGAVMLKRKAAVSRPQVAIASHKS